MKRGPKTIWGITLTRLIGIILTPALIAGVFIWGLWDPVARLGNVTAAVVNLDEPVEIDGQITPLGRVLAAELIGTSDDNFHWQLTDETDAEEGLESGKYVTVVTIPENFSAAATSLSDGPSQAQQARITIETSQKAKLLDPALSAAVTGTATRVLNEQLGRAFVGNIFVGMAELGEGIEQVGAGAEELSSGLDQLTTGLKEAAGGTGQLQEGAGLLAAGNESLAGGLGQTAAGASQLSGGLREYASGVSDFTAGVHSFAGGTSQFAGGAADLASGSSELAAGAEELSAGVTEYTSTVNGVLEPVNGFLADLIPALEDFRADVEGGRYPLTPEQQEQLLELIDQVIAVPEMLESAIEGGEALAAGASQLAGGSRDLAAGADELAGGAQSIAGGAAGLAGGADELEAGAWDLAGGVGELASGISQLEGGAAELSSASQQLVAGLPELVAGLQQLAEGAGDAASGSHELAGGLGQIAGNVPSYTDAEIDRFAELAVTPVANNGQTALFNGSGAPLFVAIALWAGALASFLLVRPLWGRTREAALSEATITLKSAAPAFLLGVLQGALVGLGVAIALSLNALSTLSFMLVAAVTGAVFSLINQALVALFGGYGRFVSLAILAIGFVAGIVSTAPGIMQTVADFSPIGAAINALLAAVGVGQGAGLSAVQSAAGSGVMLGLLILAVWGALGFVIIGAAVHRKRTTAH